MKANILGEDDDATIIQVYDTRGVEHALAIEPEGTIQEHGQEEYPVPEERTFAEDESVSQARRFARWHVYREKGYDTVPNPDNPDRLAAVLMAVLDLEDEAFDEYFGTLYEQMASHERSDVMPVLDIPDAVYNEEFIVYKQNIYLEKELDTIQEELQRPAVEVLGEDTIRELVDAQGQGLVAKARSLIGGGTDQTDDEFDPDVSFTDLTIADVSGIDTMYSEPDGYKTIEGDDPIDREPDARIETLPMGFTREQFRRHVGHILVCQIRDCFVSMGLEPPAQYRVLGHGKFKYSAKYRDFDFYPDYWDHDAQISGYLSPV